MAKFPSKGQRTLDSKRMGGGAATMVTKIKRIAAPTPPKAGSMTAMGGKLRKGD